MINWIKHKCCNEHAAWVGLRVLTDLEKCGQISLGATRTNVTVCLSIMLNVDSNLVILELIERDPCEMFSIIWNMCR